MNDERKNEKNPKRNPASQRSVTIVEATPTSPKHVIDLSKSETEQNEAVVSAHGIGGVLFLCGICGCEYTVRKDSWKTGIYIRDNPFKKNETVCTTLYRYTCPECGSENETYKEWIEWYLKKKNNDTNCVTHDDSSKDQLHNTLIQRIMKLFR